MKLEERTNRIKKLEKNISQSRKERDRYFYQILEKLDTEEILAGLNAPDDVLELLSTVIRPPATDAPDSSHSHVTLNDFWKSLVVKEGSIVRNLLDLSTKDITSAVFFRDWAEHVDDFNDLKYSLYARIYLIEIFHNILQ